MAIDYNAKTRRYFEKQGYLVGKTDCYNCFSRKTNDLFGFIDMLAVRPNDKPIGIQSTDYSHVSARVKKIKEHENFNMISQSHMDLVVIGWRKVKNRWVPRIVEI